MVIYFTQETGKDVNIEYEFLRDGPTQSGTSYPKYYLWVKIFNQNIMIDEGAVRVVAIDKKVFEITNFLSKDDIKTNPSQIDPIFPLPVCEKIKMKL